MVCVKYAFQNKFFAVFISINSTTSPPTRDRVEELGGFEL
jgi:hypothetical protein